MIDNDNILDVCIMVGLGGIEVKKKKQLKEFWLYQMKGNLQAS